MKKLMQWMIGFGLLAYAIYSIYVMITDIKFLLEVFTDDNYSMDLRLFVGSCVTILCLLMSGFYAIRACISVKNGASHIIKSGIIGVISHLVSLINILITLLFDQYMSVEYHLPVSVVFPIMIFAVGLLCKYKGADHMYRPIFSLFTSACHAIKKNKITLG